MVGQIGLEDGKGAVAGRAGLSPSESEGGKSKGSPRFSETEGWCTDSLGLIGKVWASISQSELEGGKVKGSPRSSGTEEWCRDSPGLVGVSISLSESEGRKAKGSS